MAVKKEQTAHTPESTVTDDMVRDYLTVNDDFLQRNPDILDCLHVPHASGSAVSLVEKQVKVLREKNVEMRHRLKALTATAKDNDKLFEKSRKLVLSLLEADSLHALYAAYHHAMTTDFGVENSAMILFGDYQDVTDSCRVEPADTAKAELGALLRGGKPVCGSLRKEALSYLFPGIGDAGSAAVMPLDGDVKLGLIAVGSSDPNHYNNTVGTLFLSQIADVVVRLIPRFERQ
ncbi:MAG: hypothetical protein ACJAZ0_001089 [Halioglobus sp.]|jgi:uncharacterized protein YigA (DUF484 family)